MWRDEYQLLVLLIMILLLKTVQKWEDREEVPFAGWRIWELIIFYSFCLTILFWFVFPVANFGDHLAFSIPLGIGASLFIFLHPGDQPYAYWDELGDYCRLRRKEIVQGRILRPLLFPKKRPKLKRRKVNFKYEGKRFKK